MSLSGDLFNFCNTVHYWHFSVQHENSVVKSLHTIKPPPHATAWESLCVTHLLHNQWATYQEQTEKQCLNAKPVCTVSLNPALTWDKSNMFKLYVINLILNHFVISLVLSVLFCQGGQFFEMTIGMIKCKLIKIHIYVPKVYKVIYNSSSEQFRQYGMCPGKRHATIFT